MAVWRPGLFTSCSLADPLGHRRPRDTGESGSPSIWMTRSSLTYTFCPQPTAQYGHTLCTTRSAVAVRGAMAWVRADIAAGPRPNESGPVNCRTTGHDSKVDRRLRCDGFPDFGWLASTGTPFPAYRNQSRRRNTAPDRS